MSTNEKESVFSALKEVIKSRFSIWRNDGSPIYLIEIGGIILASCLIFIVLCVMIMAGSDILSKTRLFWIKDKPKGAVTDCHYYICKQESNDTPLKLTVLAEYESGISEKIMDCGPTTIDLSILNCPVTSPFSKE